MLGNIEGFEQLYEISKFSGTVTIFGAIICVKN